MGCLVSLKSFSGRSIFSKFLFPLTSNSISSGFNSFSGMRIFFSQLKSETNRNGSDDVIQEFICSIALFLVSIIVDFFASYTIPHLFFKFPKESKLSKNKPISQQYNVVNGKNEDVIKDCK